LSITLPSQVMRTLGGRTMSPVRLGESGAHVWRCAAEGETTLYLKAAPVADGLHLEREAHRLRWLAEHALPVANVVEAGCADDVEYLITEELPGVPASDPRWSAQPERVVATLGELLRALHATPASDCPFNQRLARQVDDARARVAAGVVREDDLDESRLGRTAVDLFAELLASQPEEEDLVVVHGDFCLPNVILAADDAGAITASGMIDCGRAGVADRHQDIALATRSLRFNGWGDWVPLFLASYGMVEPDPAKLEFYMLLDEFF
jgi:aminoglycoside phosphotransferase